MFLELADIWMDLIVFADGVLTLMCWVFGVQGAAQSFSLGLTTLWYFCLSCISEGDQMSIHSSDKVFCVKFESKLHCETWMHRRGLACCIRPEIPPQP